jgi:hypothetical protein
MSPMTSPSDGSQPDAKSFLDDKVEKLLSNLQQERIPSGFDQLAKGEIPDDIRTKVLNRQIVI